MLLFSIACCHILWNVVAFYGMLSHAIACFLERTMAECSGKCGLWLPCHKSKCGRSRMNNKTQSIIGLCLVYTACSSHVRHRMQMACISIACQSHVRGTERLKQLDTTPYRNYVYCLILELPSESSGKNLFCPFLDHFLSKNGHF